MNIVNPTDVRTLKDGRIMIAWTIDESTGYQLTGETIFGMTSTNAQGRSVISFIGYTSDLKKLQQEFNVAVGIAPITNNLHTMHSIYAINGTPRTHLSSDVNIIANGSKTVKLLKK